MTAPKPVMLMILDGWGLRENTAGNAVISADTPNLDRLIATCPQSRLTTSGEVVGLPEGIMGNSEVGHLNIGAGRIVYQDLLRIDTAIADGTFFENRHIGTLMEKVRSGGKTLHLMGLVSDGGVHSQLTHLIALVRMAKQKGLERVCIHAILDGRDTPPHGGIGYLKTLGEALDEIGLGRIVSLCGRYYAMDRDKRWERIERAYALYTRGQGRTASDPISAIQSAYDAGQTDEFVEPVAIFEGDPIVVEDGDGIIFFNFRADRAREITRTFTDPAFSEFERPGRPDLCGYLCMTLYDESFDLPMAFPPQHLDAILGEVVSKSGLKQLRIAETEKYAHVTYFFNGGEETPFEGEDRLLIPSPRDVPTYDYKPEMSAVEVTEAVLERINAGTYDLIVLNFANMDMVGHSGVFEAAVKAVETVDTCVGRIVAAIQDQGGALLITADHGNAEQMADDDGGPHTAHTTNPVRLLLVDQNRNGASLKDGKLGDIAPTILALMELPQPEEMTGENLLKD
ncbi:MAG: 2,3-bisphosphoglycerate-independent phosphoglycerate mutase [Desulfosarcinaceae bacterium]